MYSSRNKFLVAGWMVIALFCYGVFAVFATAPSGGYEPGDTLDPDCLPGDTDCIVAASGGGLSIGDLIGGSPDLNGILYTDESNQLITDPLFTRDTVTNETAIGKVFDVEILQYELVVADVIGMTNISNDFTVGEQIVGGTSGVTATVENQIGPFLYLSDVSGLLINGEIITGVTSGETATASAIYPNTPFVEGDTFSVFDVDTQSVVGNGTISGVSGNTYTITRGFGTIAESNLILDELGGNMSKLHGIIGFSAAPSQSTTFTGGFRLGEFLGGLIQGSGMEYAGQDTNRFGVTYLGTPIGGGDTPAAGTILGDLSVYNFTSISQTLSNANGTPEISIGATDAGAGFNNNIILSGNRMVLQNNQVISLLGRVQIGSFDYLNANDINPYPMNPDYYYLPQSRGTAGQVLTDVNGDGNVTWETPVGGTSLIGSTSDLGNETWLGTDAGSNGGSTTGTVFLGIQAGYTASSADYSNFIGQSAGYNSSGASYSNFLGYSAGAEANAAMQSNFLGQYAGYLATNAAFSNFLGSEAGSGATDASYSNFVGFQAGYGATGATHSNFFGDSAGFGATGANYSNFFGFQSGHSATAAQYSNFIGFSAGQDATNAAFSNFLSYQAGYLATDAHHSNFFGREAGSGAISANSSNFFGDSAGYQATGAASSNFFGGNAGYLATNASNSNFFGGNAGYLATNASNSNFFGSYAGDEAVDADNSNFFGSGAGGDATAAHHSNFFGYTAGFGAFNAEHSNFFGRDAGYQATNAQHSNFLGNQAGYQATNAAYSNFFGYNAGSGATNATLSVFIGDNTGSGATDAYQSFFIGPSAGRDALNANRSVFIGSEAGRIAENAELSIFLGGAAGMGAINASYSNFLGYGAGLDAAEANNANFLGQYAGYNAYSASNSTFIGQHAGYNDLVDNTGSLNDYSILIGPWSSTGDDGLGVGYSNSIAMGAYATNTASNQFMIGSATRPIDEIVMVSTGGTTCATDINGTACSSDQRLKTNITDLTTDTLDKVLNVKTVTFNWNNNTDTVNHIGFIAQDIEQYFPELVSTGSTGYLSVNYAGMTPVLVQAIREMNLKITTINDIETPNTWRDSLIAWLGNATNGITELFTDTLHAKNQICINATCIDESDLQSFKEWKISQGSVTIPDTDEQIDESSNDVLDSNDESSNPDTEPDNSEPSDVPELTPDESPATEPSTTETSSTSVENTTPTE